MATELESLHDRIGQCKLCATFTEIKKNPSLKRGNVSKIMVIGICPGNNETKNPMAFSGAGGKKLLTWLIRASIGENETLVRDNIYMTSLVKCIASNKTLPDVLTSDFRLILPNENSVINFTLLHSIDYMKSSNNAKLVCITYNNNLYLFQSEIFTDFNNYIK